MKKLLVNMFSITPFQILVFPALGGLKYWINRSGYITQLKMPFVWICAFAVLVLLSAFGTESILTSKGYTRESWLDAQPKSTMRRFLFSFIRWGYYIPIASGYLLLLYMFAPVTIVQCIALFIGIVLHSAIRYYLAKKNPHSEASS